jgi:hypothetical protein
VNVKFVQVESRQALRFSNKEKPVWFIHGLTLLGARYVYKHIFESEDVADEVVARMTDVQILDEWNRTYQWR